MGALIGGLCCAAGGIILWEAVQWKVWGPPAWLPGWVPVGQKLDPDPVSVPLYPPPVNSQDWDWHRPLLGDDALEMLGQPGVHIPPRHPDPDDEPTPEPLSADSYTSGATRADLDDPADLAVAAAMNVGTSPDVTDPDLPDWLTAPTRGTSKPCACGDRVMASAWNKPTHLEHRRVARADLDQPRKD